MSNVPSHSRTRRTHRRTFGAGDASTSRRSHGGDAYLPAIMGAEEVYDQIGIDEAGQVTMGGIAPGAITVAAFAAGIAPVLLVHGLPTLPNPAYPVDTFVYDIDAVPKSLWKNVADVWTRAIGPDDIQANSITAGQIAAGAVSTSELAVGARLTGEVANETGATPGVFIDSTGILIRNGKMTLQDEYGATTLAASGFSGSWADFIATGFYNGMLASIGSTGLLTLGRTAQLPYWTVARDNDTFPPTLDGGGSATLTLSNNSAFAGGHSVRCEWSSIIENAILLSDPVPVIGGTRYPIQAQISALAQAGSTVGLYAFVYWYKADGSLIFSTQLTPGFSVVAAGFGVDWVNLGTTTAPDTARSVKVGFVAYEDVVHNALNYVQIGAMSLGPAHAPDISWQVGSVFADTLGIALDAGITGSLVVSTDLTVAGDTDVVALNATGAATLVSADVAGALVAARQLFDTVTTSTATGTRNDTNVGANSVFRFGGAAGVIYTGFDATDKTEGRLLYIRNATGNTVTLKNEDAGSSAANRITTPGAVDFVIQARGGVLLMYDGATSRWYVVSK